MTDAVGRHPFRRSVAALAGVALLLGAAGAQAQASQPASPLTRSVSAPASSDRTDWRKLSSAQRQTLAPLEADWAGLDPGQKQKWIALAQRMPSMPPEERQRIQERMADWSRMSPVERGQARLRYLEARRSSPDGRGERWKDYEALPPDQKQQLAARAQPAASPVSTRMAVAERSARLDRADAKGPTEKSNLVTNPNFGAAPRAVAPTVIQARPGATTTLVSRQPSPPPHQQTGLPKIAASPGFVDKATLLPRRGPQGAATVSVDAADGDGEPVPRP